MRIVLKRQTAAAGALTRRILSLMVPLAVLILSSGCADRTLETRTTTWPDGSLKEQWSVRLQKDGSFVHEGRYRSWYESGRPSEEGLYRGGHKTGLWQTWYDLDPPLRAAVGHYVDGQKDGVWEYRMDPECRHAMAQASAPKSCSCCALPKEPTYADRVDQVERYRAGIPHGLWIAWYPDGQVSDSLTYTDGKLEGRTVSYHTNGRLAALTVYRGGKRESELQMWDPAGNPL